MHSVFVGNIAHDATEEALMELFHGVGLVVSFRLVFDKDTGKPKGYGYCEFAEEATAQRACDILNRRVFADRELRVVMKEDEKKRKREEEDVAGPAQKKARVDEAPVSFAHKIRALHFQAKIDYEKKRDVLDASAAATIANDIQQSIRNYVNNLDDITVEVWSMEIRIPHIPRQAALVKGILEAAPNDLKVTQGSPGFWNVSWDPEQ
jgi:RNA recognition motif-containing protein